MTDVFIMAVPWDVQRAKRANDIRKATDGTVVWDQQQNAMDTFRLLLDAVQVQGSPAFILMQDDVQLTADWREKTEAVIADRPDQVIQFFSMRAEVDSSREMPGASFISNLCVYIPAGYAAELLEYSYEFVKKYPDFKTADDFVIRYWLRGRREAYWMHVPSLVQHESWVSAINPKRPRNRRSHHFDGEA